MEKEMIATFISSAAYAPSLLPLLSPSRNLNFRCLSPLKANPQRCVVGGTKRLCVVAARGNLESTGVPTSVPVRVALELLQAGHRYLDVRHISIPIAFLLLRFNFYT
eukprot:XP_010647660.1 PREDICTED: uncharacterized protein LOC104878749 isoform X2 [Vitis vinifera]